MGRMLSLLAETGRLTADTVCRNPTGGAQHAFEPNQKNRAHTGRYLNDRPADSLQRTGQPRLVRHHERKKQK